MNRKLITASLALAALAAFAGPPTASAKPELTQPTGTTLGEGAKLEATNVGQATFTGGSFTIHCTVARFAGTLRGNTGTEIGWEISTVEFGGTGAGGDCTSGIGAAKFIPSTGTNGPPWCFSATNTMQIQDEFRIVGGVCGNARPIRFAFEMTTQGVTCTYERAAGVAIVGTYTTHPNDAVATVSNNIEFPRVEGPAMVCPLQLTLDMSFTIEKDAATAEPAYIS